MKATGLNGTGPMGRNMPARGKRPRRPGSWEKRGPALNAGEYTHFLKRQRRVHPIAQSEGLGNQNRTNLRPVRSRLRRIDSKSGAANGIADFQPAFSFPTIPGPADRAMGFWPFGPGATGGARCVYSSGRRGMLRGEIAAIPAGGLKGIFSGSRSWCEFDLSSRRAEA